MVGSSCADGSCPGKGALGPAHVCILAPHALQARPLTTVAPINSAPPSTGLFSRRALPATP